MYAIQVHHYILILKGISMADWSDAMKFNAETLNQNRVYLNKPGVYELGIIRGEDFFPKYIGKASGQTLFERLQQYHYPSKQSKIPPQLRHQIYRHRNMVWFHVFSTSDPFLTEQRLLNRHKIGKDAGLYEWNRKYG